MPILAIRFLTGHYHATPWGHHVNEGLVEWPPSPWRLLRALLATGYTKLGWSEVPATGRDLLGKLASVLPRYALPEAATGHSRHYMPLATFDKGREATTLVLDAWARTDGGRLGVAWDVELNDAERALLGELAANLSYLGRAESWTEAELVDETRGDSPAFDTLPDAPGRGHRKGWEQIAVLAPDTPEDYRSWRAEAVAEGLAGLGTGDGKKPSKKQLEKREAVEAAHPEDLVACLQIESAWLKQLGWSQPPGSRRVLYWRRKNSLEVSPRSMAIQGTTSPVEAVLLALSTPSRNTHALPRVIRTLPQAELVHQGLVSKLELLGFGDQGWELRGVDEGSRPLLGHQHAHVVPLDLDRDGHLDHVLLWAPGGMDGAAQAAAQSLQETYAKGIGKLRVDLVSSGGLDQLEALPAPYGRELRRILQRTQGATRWRSATPFVLPRFLKRAGRNAFEGQVLAELASRRLPPAKVTVIERDGAGRTGDGEPASAVFRHFVLMRSTRRAGGWRPPPPVALGHDIELLFEEPIRGPLCLGYGSHFGLGLFRAVE